MNQMDWEIVHLLYIEKNITKTAERMFISQPALTYRIKSIEKKLHINIIHRTAQGIKFTREGEYVAEQAEKMIGQYQQLKDQLQNLHDDEGTIRIGVSTNFARFMLPQILEEFFQRYPKVKFNVITSWSESILELVEKGGVHVAIIRGDCLYEHGKILLKQEPICIISKEPIILEDLPHRSRIMFNTDPSLQQTIEHWWKQNFVKAPTVTMQIDNIETCTKMVESGLGYAIVPSVSLMEQHQLDQLPLLDEQKNVILRDTWLLQHSSSLEYPIIQKFIAFLTHMFHQNNDTHPL